MTKGRIILLNGVSSSGKTTLSKELVNSLPDFFHLSIDDYDLVIERMEDRTNQRLIPVPTEHFFHRTIRMFSDKGVNIVVDQILHDEDTLRDCMNTLQDYPVFFVGVHCPLAELERRERSRGDRCIGLAKKQLDFVHQQNIIYDVEVDTYKDELRTCVEQIINKLNENKTSDTWKSMVQNSF